MGLGVGVGLGDGVGLGEGVGDGVGAGEGAGVVGTVTGAPPSPDPPPHEARSAKASVNDTLRTMIPPNCAQHVAGETIIQQLNSCRIGGNNFSSTPLRAGGSSGSHQYFRRS